MQDLGEICMAQRSRGKHNHDTCCVKARKGFSNRRFERRFWVLLPPRAKVPRAGARNVPFSLMPRRCRGISLPPSRLRCDTSLAEGGRAAPAGRGGAMHPKGTCSASLHCVGIAPYGTTFDRQCVGAGFYPARSMMQIKTSGLAGGFDFSIL